MMQANTLHVPQGAALLLLPQIASDSPCSPAQDRGHSAVQALCIFCLGTYKTFLNSLSTTFSLLSTLHEPHSLSKTSLERVIHRLENLHFSPIAKGVKLILLNLQEQKPLIQAPVSLSSFSSIRSPHLTCAILTEFHKISETFRPFHNSVALHTLTSGPPSMYDISFGGIPSHPSRSKLKCHFLSKAFMESPLPPGMDGRIPYVPMSISTNLYERGSIG